MEDKPQEVKPVENQSLKSPRDLAIKARMLGKKTISYSQYNMYKNCPKQWKLQYIDGHKEFDPSIYLTFGTAMHEVLQEYLETMYTKTAVEANALPLEENLKTKMAHEYSETLNEIGGKHFSSPEQMKEFYEDGIAIIDFFRKKRGAYFSKRNEELVGIEMPILVETDANENIMIMGFMDIAIKYKIGNKEKIKIYDIKTSTFGWRQGQKKDNGDQLRLYKKYFSKQYGIPIDDIDVEYFIVKRKLYENVDFPQKRVQIYVPASGKPSINKTERGLTEFINNAFTPEGKKNKEANYPAVAGLKNKNCKYCPFYKRDDLCPKKERIKV